MSSIGTCDLATADLMAVAPSCGAETVARAPLNYALLSADRCFLQSETPRRTYNTDWRPRRGQNVRILYLSPDRRAAGKCSSRRGRRSCAEKVGPSGGARGGSQGRRHALRVSTRTIEGAMLRYPGTLYTGQGYQRHMGPNPKLGGQVNSSGLHRAPTRRREASGLRLAITPKTRRR
jgi:hypothetical protein